MKTSHILIICFAVVLQSCDSKKPTSKKIVTQEGMLPAKKFFDFDQIDYYITEFDEADLSKLVDSRTRSFLDSLKEDLLLGELPRELPDLSFINHLPAVGYKKKFINKTDYPKIDSLFSERFNSESVAYSCIHIYRDILIFKKQENVTGLAKICFECKDHEISGTSAFTGNFGQEGIYEELERLLHK